jgi:polysaccharide export outer membrane protein
MRIPQLPLCVGLTALLLAGCATESPRFASDPLTPTATTSVQAPAPTAGVTPSQTAPAAPAVASTATASANSPAWDLLQNDSQPPVAIDITNAAAAKLDPSLLQPPTDLFVLGPGDKLEVEIVGNIASHASPTVGMDGKLYFYFLPGVDVWGLTLAQAKARLEGELSKYVNDAHVSLTLNSVGSKFVWLLGRLNRPGVYPLQGSMSLLEALTVAGGTAVAPSSASTQDIGDLKHSFVMRDGRVLPVDFVKLIKDGDMSQNIYLRPDDFVYIPSSLSQQIYVLGAVGRPQSVPYSDGMTVVDAIASAGGTILDAYTSHVGIARGSLTQPELIVVNFKAVATGKTADVPLEPGDIVYVPLTPYHVLSDYADLIVRTFAGSWTADMGSRIVTGSSSLGVSVPVSSSAP